MFSREQSTNLENAKIPKQQNLYKINSNQKIFKTTVNSPLGDILLLSKDEKLCGLYLKKYYKSQIEAVENENLEIFFKTKLWLDKYFKKEKPDALKLDLELKGSEFQKSVWKILREIPYGKTTSYKNIALQIAKQKGVEKMSFQAIGSAIGRNPVLIVVPCHRVIAQNGGLGGFSAGLDTKIKLLKHENPDFNFN